MASIRLQCLRTIRDALAPSFPDKVDLHGNVVPGVQLWRQDGSQLGQGTTAVVRIHTDTVLNDEVAHTGRIARELSIVVDVYLQATDEDPLDDAADEVVDAATLTVERELTKRKALGGIDWAPIFGDSVSMVRLSETLPFVSTEGQARVGSTVRASLKYEHQVDNPEAR